MEPLSLYERVVLLERDIQRCVKDLSKWLEFAMGLHDVKKESQYVLDNTNELIKRILLETPIDLSNDPMEWDPWLCDIFYDYSFKNADDFKSNYKMVILEAGKKEFDRLVNLYSVESAIKKVKEINADLTRLYDLLFGITSLFNDEERKALDNVRWGPESRINKPSFNMFLIGDKIAEGLKNGLEEEKQ